MGKIKKNALLITTLASVQCETESERTGVGKEERATERGEMSKRGGKGHGERERCQERGSTAAWDMEAAGCYRCSGLCILFQ